MLVRYPRQVRRTPLEPSHQFRIVQAWPEVGRHPGWILGVNLGLHLRLLVNMGNDLTSLEVRLRVIDQILSFPRGDQIPDRKNRRRDGDRLDLQRLLHTK